MNRSHIIINKVWVVMAKMGGHDGHLCVSDSVPSYYQVEEMKGTEIQHFLMSRIRIPIQLCKW